MLSGQMTVGRTIKNKKQAMPDSALGDPPGLAMRPYPSLAQFPCRKIQLSASPDVRGIQNIGASPDYESQQYPPSPSSSLSYFSIKSDSMQENTFYAYSRYLAYLSL